MRVLITGATGMLGSAMTSVMQSKHSVFAFGGDKFDILDNPRHLDLVVKRVNPDYIINCAAYTKVDQAENYPDLSYMLNTAGVINLASVCKWNGVKLIHFTSDYAFPQSYHCGPKNIYGRSKLAGDVALMEILHPSQYLLIRTSWLFGGKGPDFVRSIIKKAKDGQELKVVNDQIGSPTYVGDLAGAVSKLIDKSAYGQFNVTNFGDTTWYDYAKFIAKAAKLDVKITPISSEDANFKAERPKESRLNTKPLQAMGIVLPYWQWSVANYIEVMRQDGEI